MSKKGNVEANYEPPEAMQSEHRKAGWMRRAEVFSLSGYAQGASGN